MKRPANLVYGLDEAPPLLVTALNGIQHVGLISINLVYPLLVFRLAGLGTGAIVELIAAGMVILGVATFLQVQRNGPLGSGFLCPAAFSATYISPSLLAVKSGGLPLVFGLTVFAGAFEIVLSRFLMRLRAILPTELSGFVIFMIGSTAGISGLRSLLGSHTQPVTATEWWVAFITLATMVALNVWGRGIAKMLCALIGVGIGYATAAAAGLLGAAQLAGVADAPWMALPRFGNVSWSFNSGLAVTFAIASVAAAMKAVGTIAVCQRMNDADWVRPDMRSVTRGVLADGVSTVLAGLAGAVGTNTSTPSVGLASATGVASRRVSYAIGIIFILLGLTPKIAALLAVMPRSVMVAALIFAVCFILINGLQVMTSRLLDARRTIVLGLAIITGAAVDVFPTIAAGAPRALAPVVGSALAFSTLVALILNLLFRIGVKKTVELSISPDLVKALDPKEIEEFLHAQGAAWGARPEVVTRAVFAVTQLIEAVAENCWQRGPLTLAASFDEFNLEVRLSYQGEPLEFPDQRPSERDIIEAEDGARRLAGFMLRHNADRVRSSSRDGRAQVLFHFDH